MEESLWRSDMAVTFYGLCHTFIYPHKISADYRTTVNRRDSQAFLSLVQLPLYWALIDPELQDEIFLSSYYASSLML